MSAPPPVARTIGEAENALRALLMRQLEGEEMSYDEWVALSAIRAGEHETPHDLARRVATGLGVEPGSARDIFRRLRRAGWLESPDEQVTFTEAGRVRFDDLRRQVGGASAYVFADLEPTELDVVHRVLGTITARARDGGPA